MAFIDDRLPLSMELEAERTEKEALEIVETDSGHEIRNIEHAQNTFSYSIGYPPQGYEAEAIAKAKLLWKASRGGLHYFRFRDWDPENSELDAEEIGIGDGADTTFQVIKTWSIGGQEQVRNITRPVSPLSVYIDDVLQVGGYTVNYATGVITFSVAPSLGEVITVSGLYDIPVRFDAQISAVGLTHALEHLQDITLIEVKE